jgi:hypothetical protein
MIWNKGCQQAYHGLLDHLWERLAKLLEGDHFRADFAEAWSDRSLGARLHTSVNIKSNTNRELPPRYLLDGL